MSYSPDEARSALRQVMVAHKLSARGLSKLAGLSPSAITQFMKARVRSLTAETYDAIAAGLSKKIGREVDIAELRGEIPVERPVSAFIGAGDEVVPPVDGDGPIDHVAAPRDFIEGEIAEVRGRSMLPFFEPGDLIFFTRADSPRALLNQVAVVKLKDNRRFVKTIQAGSKRGRFTLASVNPAYPPMEDQIVVWAARIAWVKKAGT